MLTGLHEMARSTQAASHIRRLPASITKSLAPHYKAHPGREEGSPGGYKAPTVTQTAAVSEVFFCVAKPMKMSWWQQGDSGQLKN